jgi:hypothetical protein
MGDGVEGGGEGNRKIPFAWNIRRSLQIKSEGWTWLAGGSRGRKDPSRNSTEIFLMFGELNGPCVGPT